MVHYPPIKMTNQIVQHSTNQKDHLNMLNMSISTCPNWQDGLFDAIPNGVSFY
jgi:hypothetical protein